MDGKNCNGRKISLLNDDISVAAVPSRIQLPPLQHSRTSSCASSPSPSPQTPSLVRSSSSDSRTTAYSSPSPLTPSYNTFDHAAASSLQSQAKSQSQSQSHRHQPYQHHQQQYYIANLPYSKSKMDANQVPLYPDPTVAIPPYPLPAQMPSQAPIPQSQNESNSPASEPSRVSSMSAQSNAKSQPKKNQYPCPMAKQVGCTDFFTTSGHAARHAKKHTGKKDAFCPECNKAFTRKDNMEQHRRTHQNGRGASRTNNDDAKVKKSTKQPAKKTTAKPDPILEAAVEQQLADQVQVAPLQVQAAPVAQQAVEQAMLLPTTGPYFLNGTIDSGPIPALPMAMPELHVRPPLHRSSFASSLDYIAPAAPMVDPDTLHYSYPSPGLSNGLNSLALAAAEAGRMNGKAQSSRSSSTEAPAARPTP